MSWIDGIGSPSASMERYLHAIGSCIATISKMTDDLTDIPTFVAVVQAGGFAAAANRLNVSRSAVGKSIARLEARLGARLFNRTTRRQSLTEDGEFFFDHCRRALDELKAGRARLESGRRAIEGRLRVSMPELFGRLCVAPVLTRLAELHEGLELELQFTDRKVDMLEEGIDISIRMGSLERGTGLMTRRIGREQVVVCAAPALLQSGPPQSTDDLANYPAITYYRNGRSQTWLLRDSHGSPVEVSPHSRLRFGDLHAICDAAVAGHGLAWLPLWLARDKLRTGELVRLLDEHPASGFDIHALWQQAQHVPPRIRVALDTLIVEVPGFVGSGN